MNPKLKRRFYLWYHYLRQIGLDPLATFDFIRGIGFYVRDYFRLTISKGKDKTFPMKRWFPILGERFLSSGTMRGHYFHQDLYIAKRIFESKPEHHLDIGSRTDGFVAHVSVFMPIEIVDIRDQVSKVPNVSFRKVDLMELPIDMVNKYSSISSLHAIEHFGLGRYGDPIDYYGYLKALENISKMLKPDGRFYFSVPIGEQRIEFNAHRVFSVAYLMELLQRWFEIKYVSYVDDSGDLYERVNLNPENISTNFGCYYGCGIFELTKK